MRRIAIVTMGGSGKSGGWKSWPEIWALGHHRGVSEHATRLFEVHDPSIWNQWCGHDYVERLNALEIPVWMREPHHSIKPAVQLPVDEIASEFMDYFTSSMAYELGLIALEHVRGDEVEEVGLYGVDLHHQSEYNFERPCVEFWLGILYCLGIKIFVAEGSKLFSSPYPGRYGELPKSAS